MISCIPNSFVVPVNATLLRHPSGHIRIEENLKIFCNISVDSATSSAISNSDINITVSWGKADQPVTDQHITSQTSNSHYTISEVVKSDDPRVYIYSSILLINSLTFADSEIYTCTATISPRLGSSSPFNVTKQVLNISIQLSKFTLSSLLSCI